MTRWRTQTQPDPLREDEVHLWLVPLTKHSEQLLPLVSILSADEKERAQGFRNVRDRERWIIARASLRYLLARYSSDSPEQIKFTKGPFGKPRIETSGANLEFNVSHSHEKALFGFTLGRKIGVDLEAIHPGTDILAVAEAQFAREEFQQLCHLPADEQREAFYRAWTRREAYLKACGAGLSLGLNGSEFGLGLKDAVITDAGSSLVLNGTLWTLQQLFSAPQYAGCAVVEGERVRFRFFRLDSN